MIRYRGVLDDDSDPSRDDTAALRALVEQAIEITGSMAALARRLGTTPSHVSRIRAGLVGAALETCLYLADVLDEGWIVILDKCGYARLSDKIEGLRQGRKLPVRPAYTPNLINCRAKIGGLSPG